MGQRYYSSRETVSALGVTWEGGKIDIVSAENWENATVRISNHSGELTNQIMSGSWRGGEAKIYLAEQEDHPGLSGHSVIFDGVSGRMTVPTSATGHPVGNNAHTLESWLYIESLKVRRGNIITLYPAGIGGMHWLLNRDATIQAGRWGGGGGVLVKVPVKKWFHFASSYHAPSGMYRVYLNGQLEAETQVTTPFILHGGFTAGQNVSGQQWSHVRMAELRLWNVHRTQIQINNEMFRRMTPTDNLMGLWQPSVNNNSIVPDNTARNNHATLAGGTEIRSVEGVFYVIFEGEAVAAPSVTPWAEIELTRKGSGTNFTPRWRVSRPVFNHLPPPGKVIAWDGDLYELRPE